MNVTGNNVVVVHRWVDDSRRGAAYKTHNNVAIYSNHFCGVAITQVSDGVVKKWREAIIKCTVCINPKTRRADWMVRKPRHASGVDQPDVADCAHQPEIALRG